MLNGYRVLDADCHVLEPDAIWEERMPARFRGRGPRWVRAGSGGTAWRYVIDGEEVHHRLSDAVAAEASQVTVARFGDELGRDGIPPAAQCKALGRMGADAAFLYPTVGLQLLAVDPLEPALTVALARAYNDWLRDFCAAAPELLRPVGLVSRHDPAAMVEELDRIAGFGWRAVVLRPNPVRGRRLGDPVHEPFWSECERRGVAVALHEGTHGRLPAAGADRFATRFALHACSHPMEQMMAFLDLLEAGVLERHPRLRFAFLEAGAGWLPYWLWRLDEVEYAKLAWEVRPHVLDLPSAYFRRQCFVSIDPGEPGLGDVVRAVGADCLLFGSDYPHMDHEVDIVARAVALAGRLGEDTVRKLLWDNPCRFYCSSP